MILFLNSNFSINTCSIPFKFLEYDVYSLLEGSMSQNFDLGPSYFFMLCRNLDFFVFSLLFMFYIIKMELGPKSKF